jgi:hypothetical protein
MNKMRGMTAFAGHFRREPYLSKGGRVPARSRAPAKSKGSDGGARQGALRQALHGRLVRPAAAVRFRNWDSKSPRPVSQRGLDCNFRDDEDMPVICPTGQVFFWSCLLGQDASYANWRLVQIRL